MPKWTPRGKAIAEMRGVPYVGPFDRETVHQRLDHLVAKHDCVKAGCVQAAATLPAIVPSGAWEPNSIAFGSPRR